MNKYYYGEFDVLFQICKDGGLNFCGQNGIDFIYEMNGEGDFKFEIIDKEVENLVLQELKLMVVFERIDIGLVIFVVSVNMKEIVIVV